MKNILERYKDNEVVNLSYFQYYKFKIDGFNIYVNKKQIDLLKDNTNTCYISVNVYTDNKLLSEALKMKKSDRHNKFYKASIKVCNHVQIIQFFEKIEMYTTHLIKYGEYYEKNR